MTDECLPIKNALRQAILIIMNYEADIRNAEDIVGVNLVEKGFCQGVIYKEALSDIRRMAELPQ